jgi:CubicO group peptidase (beta-lactamase class C family)
MDSDHFGVDRRVLGLGLLGVGAAASIPAWAQKGAVALPSIPNLPAARPESVGLTTAGLAKIGDMMQGYIDKNQITGGVTAVARRNKLVHFQSHGQFDLDARSPMRRDGMFRMMSSTKPTTAVALLQQMELGKISLDDKVSKFIPELREMRVLKVSPPGPLDRAAGAAARGPGQGPGRDGVAAPVAPAGGPRRGGPPPETVPAVREITIKDLVTHTSGLNGTPRREPGDTLATAIPRLKDVPLDFQPGTKWAYSATTGPDVLARIIEITSGVPHDVYMRERVFEPIGMTSTAYNLTPEQGSRLVPRYVRQADKWGIAPGRDSKAEAPPPVTFYPGSWGLMSTCQDYLLFETMLLNKGTIHGKRVLKPESVELMHTNLIGDMYHGLQGTTQGTGFGVLVRVVLDPATCGCGRSLGGFGWGGAYGTMSWTDPKEQLVASLFIQQPVDTVQHDFEMTIRNAMIA